MNEPLCSFGNYFHNIGGNLGGLTGILIGSGGKLAKKLYSNLPP